MPSRKLPCETAPQSLYPPAREAYGFGKPAAGLPPLPQQDFDSVIALLHDGVFEQPYWTEFLAKLRILTGADYASLTFRRADARHKDLNIIKSGFADASPEFNDIHDHVKQLRLLYDTLDRNRPYTLQDILDVNDTRYAEYMRYLEHRRINHAFVIRVTEPGGGNCWLSIGRPGTDFADGIRSFLIRLAPHLSIAARTLAALEHERMRADVAEDAVRRLNFGWVTFDGKAQVIEIDPETERLFQDTNLGPCRRGQILPLRRGDMQNLISVLTDFSEQTSSKPRTIHVNDEPCLDMLILPIVHRAVSGGKTPVAIGYVHGVGAFSDERCEQLAKLFDLTPNEARLAVALSQGKTIAEAATQLHLTIETARNYSKRIYGKTGTRGQADLVRIILASVIALT